MTRRNAGEGHVRERRPGLWEAQYTGSDGRRHSVNGKTKRVCGEKLAEALRDAKRGILPVSQELTVGAHLESWLRVVKATTRPRTHESYQDTVTRYILPSLENVKLAKVQPDHVRAMLDDVRKAHPALSATTQRYVLTVLRIALGRAVKDGVAHRNVTQLVDMPAPARPKVSPMTADQTRAFLRAVKGDRLEPLYRLAVATGLRQGELLALRWQDVDLDEGPLDVRHTLQVRTRELAEPKTEQAKRRIALDEDTVAMLRAHRLTSLEAQLSQPKRRKGADYVFVTREGTPMHARDVLRSYHEALERAGRCGSCTGCTGEPRAACLAPTLTRLPFHQLRHGFATLMLEAGEELANVSKVLGHSTYATSVDFYGHLTPTISRRAASRMREILAG